MIMDDPRSPIQSFYKDKTIFLTGATGYMGKVLLEKLLYSCSDLDKIYILIRPKRGCSIEVRLNDIFKSPMFHRIRQEKNHVLKKVQLLDGDISTHNLGLTDEQRETLKNEVHIILHFAAILRMNAKLKDAIELNMIGTKRMLDLAKQMKHLQVFLYLSTAYCYVEKDVLDENIYDPSQDPNDIMRLVQWMDERTIDLITPKLLDLHPNTYTYTKRLTETLVAREYPHIPCVIARPSIITPAVKEPLPGWVDSLNGAIGIFVNMGKGLLRTMLAKSQTHSNMMPVDVAINAVIGISHKVATQEKSIHIPVYNITPSDTIRITWGQLHGIHKRVNYEYPYERQVWYPNSSLRVNKTVHYLLFSFLIILAYLIDFLMLILQRERFMVRRYKLLSNGLSVLQYFCMRNWKFDNTKFLTMRNEMSPEDQKTFQIYLEQLDIEEYMKNFILGTRQYCMKESLSSLPQARRHQTRMYIVYLFTKFLFYSGILYIIYSLVQ